MKLNKFSSLLYVFVPWMVFPPGVQNNFLPMTIKNVALGSQDCRKIYQKFSAYVASDGPSREKGLSHRAYKMNKSEAMLFVFEVPEKVTFWMKDTLIPLDILFFEPNGKLLNKERMSVEKNPKVPTKNYSSKGLANVALEIGPQDTPKDPYLCVEK